MLQNNLLNKIDMCLKYYVDKNNARYKRNISTTLMTKKQLTNFYCDMQQVKQQENMRKKRNKENVDRGPKKKSKSINSFPTPLNKFVSAKDNFKRDHPDIVDWRKVNKISMNEKPLISNPVNLQDQTKGPLKNMSRNFSQKQNEDCEKIKVRWKRREQKGGMNALAEEQKREYVLEIVEIKEEIQKSEEKNQNEKKQSWLNLNIKGAKKSNQTGERDQQVETEEIKAIRAEQQVKYIKKHLRHIKNRQIYEDNNREGICQKQFQVSPEQVEQIKIEMNNIEKEEKLHLKLKQIFENYAEKMEKEQLLNTSKQVEAIKREKERRDCYSAAIQSYFIRKNLHHRTCLQIKQQKMKAKYSKKAKLLESNLISQFAKKDKKYI